MSFYDVDWSQFLSEDSEIIPDVEFRVIESCEGKEEKTGVVKAHKLLLSGVSVVFRKQFYGPMNEKLDAIDVKETTIEAFTTMINFFYDKSSTSTCSIRNTRDLEALFELLNVANKYLVTSLVDEVEKVIANCELSMDTVLLAAKTAQVYSHFDKAADGLTNNCARFLDKALQSKEDMYAFFLSMHSKFPESDSDLILNLLRLNAPCPNCKSAKITDCLHGTDVNAATVGLKVSCKKTGEYKLFQDYGEATIREIGSKTGGPSLTQARSEEIRARKFTAVSVGLTFKLDFTNSFPIDDNFDYHLKTENSANFIFHCKKECVKKANSSKHVIKSPSSGSFIKDADLGAFGSSPITTTYLSDVSRTTPSDDVTVLNGSTNSSITATSPSGVTTTFDAGSVPNFTFGSAETPPVNPFGSAANPAGNPFGTAATPVVNPFSVKK